MGYADALAGVPYAQSLNAPILLTGKDSLDKATLAEIKRLGAKKIKILGGEGAIGKNVVDELIRNGIKKGNIERISGKSRYAAAAAIAEKLDPSPEVVFFVFGGGYADALSISPVAAIKKAPIIYLTTSGELNADSAAYLARLKKKKCVKTAYCIGGSGVISDQMMQSVRTALDLQQENQLHRIYGINRYDTSCAVYSWFGYSTLKGSSVCIATGKKLPRRSCRRRARSKVQIAAAACRRLLRLFKQTESRMVLQHIHSRRNGRSSRRSRKRDIPQQIMICKSR